MSARFLSVTSDNLWLDHEFPRGMTALIGLVDDGVERVLRLAAGCQRPDRGVVSIAQRPPLNDPATRAAIGTVFEHEWAPRGVTVAQWLERLRRHHAPGTSSKNAQTCLGRLGLDHLAGRSTNELNENDRRAALLALALGLDAPLLLALSTPFSIAGVDRARLAAELARHATRAVVLFSTAHVSDAELTGAERLVFAGGRLMGALQATDGLGSRVCYRVTCDAPGLLCAGLLALPEVTSVSAPQHARTLEVEGMDALKLSLAILEQSATLGVKIENLVEAAADLQALQAHARGRRDAEYHAATTTAEPIRQDIPATLTEPQNVVMKTVTENPSASAESERNDG